MLTFTAFMVTLSAGACIGFFFRSIMSMAATFLLALALLPTPANAECLPSLHAARDLHPTGRISWSGGCYFAGYPGQRHASSADRKHEAKAVPLQKERPTKFASARPDEDMRRAAPATADKADPVGVKSATGTNFWGTAAWEPSTSPWRIDDAFSRVTWPMGAWQEAGR